MRQQQEQQQQQTEMIIRMLQNLGLQSQPTVALPPHPPPLQPQNGRLEAGFCPQCERQEPHVCALSEEGGSVASCSRGAEVMGSPPGRRAPPDAPHQYCPVSRWVNSENGAARLAGPNEQLLPEEAAAGPLQNYAGSVVSSLASQHEV